MPPSSPSTGKPRRLGAVVATLAASIAVGVLLRAVVFTAPASSSDAGLFLCSLEGFNEGVCVAGELVTEECQVAAGQNVTTGGPLGTAKLRFADGTIIQLTGDSAARVYSSNGQKVVYVDRGHVGAEVAPQPRGRPLMIHTPNASLEVVGTEFVFSVSDVSTELNVTEGEVLMKPKGGGKGVAVKGGEYSAVHGDQREQILESILPAYRTANTPTHWQERFDHGLPEKWQAGTWVPTDADGQAGGAVAACVELPVSADEQSPSVSDEVHYVVQSMANWPQGLVRLTEDSRLRYRVKMDRPQWYQVFIVVRGGPIEDGTWSWNYEFQESSQGNWSGVTPGEWREVSVPISEFKRNNHPKYHSTEQPHFDEREGNPPPADGLVVWVLFSTQEFDRGLAIDDLTITSPALEAASGQHGESS